MAGTHRRLGVALAAALVLAALPAAAAPPGAAARGPAAAAPAGGLDALLAALPGDAAVAADVEGELTEPVRSARAALLAVSDHRDTPAWLRAVGGAVTVLTGLEPVGRTAETHEGEPAAEDPDEEGVEDGFFDWSGSFADARAAGDLSGDGRDDVLVIDYDLPTWDLQLRAVSGADGSELWRQPYAGDGWLAFPLGEDLTGDGRPDVLSLRLRTHLVRSEATSSEGPLGSHHSEEWAIDFTWVVEVLSGATGQQAWGRSLPGALVERYESERGLLGSSSSYEIDGTNVWALALPTADEVLVEGVDLHMISESSDEGLLLVGSSEERFAVHGETRAELRDGGTGALRGELHAPRAASVDLLLPAGDLTGDGRDDLLWERVGQVDDSSSCTTVLVETCEGGEVRPGLALEAVDGASLASVWSRAEPAPYGFVEALGVDLDGDGRDDLLLHTEDLELEPVEEDSDETTGEEDEEAMADVPWATTVISGGDGATSWTHAEPGSGWLWAIGTGDLGGSGATDLLAAAHYYDESEGAEGMRVDRLDGATGAVLSSSSIVPERPDTGEDENRYGFAFPFAMALDDLDGDGAPEVSLGSVAGVWSIEEGEDEEGWWYEFTVEHTASTTVIESGRTAEELHAEAHEGLEILLPITDLTGDGIVDGVRLREGQGEGETSSYTAFDYVALADGWTRQVDGWFYLVPGGDQEGTGAHSLLEHVDRWTEEGLTTTVTSLAGRSGAPRWSLRSEERG